MKIDDPLKKSIGLGVSATPARPGKTTEKEGVDKTPSDNVTLSAKARALASQSSDTGVFDSKKVDEIKAAIANGQFKVNAERVAAGLIDSVRDLVSTHKG